LPNTPEFHAVRDQNFRNATAGLLERLIPEWLDEKEGVRVTFTRSLTRSQARSISAYISTLVGYVGGVPEEDGADELYSLGVIFGARVGL
jgi:hypothetical protein